MFKFKILRGIHAVGDRVYGPRDVGGNPTQPDGDVFESASDLRRFNVEHAPRFQLLESSVPISSKGCDDDDGLDSMSLADLRGVAEVEEIDVETCNTKKQVIASIRNTRGTNQPVA